MKLIGYEAMPKSFKDFVQKLVEIDEARNTHETFWYMLGTYYLEEKIEVRLSPELQRQLDIFVRGFSMVVDRIDRAGGKPFLDEVVEKYKKGELNDAGILKEIGDSKHMSTDLRGFSLTILPTAIRNLKSSEGPLARPDSYKGKRKRASVRYVAGYYKAAKVIVGYQFAIMNFETLSTKMFNEFNTYIKENVNFTGTVKLENSSGILTAKGADSSKEGVEVAMEETKKEDAAKAKAENPADAADTNSYAANAVKEKEAAEKEAAEKAKKEAEAAKAKEIEDQKKKEAEAAKVKEIEDQKKKEAAEKAKKEAEAKKEAIAKAKTAEDQKKKEAIEKAKKEAAEKEAAEKAKEVEELEKKEEQKFAAYNKMSTKALIIHNILNTKSGVKYFTKIRPDRFSELYEYVKGLENSNEMLKKLDQYRAQLGTSKLTETRKEEVSNSEEGAVDVKKENEQRVKSKELLKESFTKTINQPVQSEKADDREISRATHDKGAQDEGTEDWEEDSGKEAPDKEVPPKDEVSGDKNEKRSTKIWWVLAGIGGVGLAAVVAYYFLRNRGIAKAMEKKSTASNVSTDQSSTTYSQAPVQSQSPVINESVPNETTNDYVNYLTDIPKRKLPPTIRELHRK